MRKAKKKSAPKIEDDEMLIQMEASDDCLTVTLTFTQNKPIDLHDLVIGIEGYLTELTRAEKQKEGAEVH